MKHKKGIIILVVAASLIVMLTAAGMLALYYDKTSILRDRLADLRQIFFRKRPAISFVDVTSQSGIDFKHFNGARTNQLPEDMGSGAAWFDYDGDGWQDLFVANISGPLTMTDEELQHSPAYSRLYRNNGDGSFTDVTEEAGVALRGYGMGVAVGDYDNDGWPDLFMASYGHNVLLNNNGDGTFTDVTRQASLYGYEGFWSSGRWGDYDRDGYLDLYVTGYLKYTDLASRGENRRRMNIMVPFQLSPGAFESESNLLFHNNGDGTFTERSARLNVRDIGGKSLAASWCDFNNDNWPDLMIANDVTPNTLYLNHEGRTFVKEPFFSDKTDTRGSMGIAVGDSDGDQDMDIYITNWLLETNELLINQSDGKSRTGLYHFLEMAMTYNVGKPSKEMVGWGTGFYDFDNDTYLDLFVTNGSTNPEAEDPLQLITMPNQFFWNRGAGEGFSDMTASLGEDMSRKIVGRGAAFADYDGDGDVDVFIVNHGGHGILLRNQSEKTKNWIQVLLEGTESNRSAIGAKLRLKVNGRTFIREVGVQPSYMSHNSLVQHFGLGNYSSIDSLTVSWPSGHKQVHTDLQVNKVVRIKEGEQDL